LSIVQDVEESLGDEMIFWIDPDKAIPAFSDQLVKVKVADLGGDYTTYAYYIHRLQEWWSKDGYCLNDNVYAWKPVRKRTLNVI
jgi:hypothetical protein